MYLTSRFPALGFDEFWVSPPEYFEFREINQSFSAVGAFTTGEVNLTAGERPRRVRSASVTTICSPRSACRRRRAGCSRRARPTCRWPTAAAGAAAAAAAARGDPVARAVAAARSAGRPMVGQMSR